MAPTRLQREKNQDLKSEQSGMTPEALTGHNGAKTVDQPANFPYEGAVSLPARLRTNGDDKKVAETTVFVWQESVSLPTYLPAAPDKNPMFMEKRVYQGSSGRVYPLPFTDRISETRLERKWKVIWLENEYLRVMILPEIGGRIHAILDKTNGYDLIYNQKVIKPALVGLAGPWVSGGIEFNWPQHHRPATFLPADCEIEKHADGSATVWCSDHDPMSRMKGMHGVCLHPGKAMVELKVRAYNRTPLRQTFLWWANVAARVHEAYQSFFPPDVYYVADHARRSMSRYPLCEGRYYGVDYGARAHKGVSSHEVPGQFVPPHCGNTKPSPNGPQGGKPNYAPNDLSFYANIATPCSYMCMGSKEDFFGGYDYKAQAGIVHIANHHISPGKKQWTWGNHPFGYAWDRNLTDADEKGEFGPYIEIMAGVYTDNQPDFSFLQPGETKSWSQYWYPIQKIGPAQKANVCAAVSLRTENRSLHVGIAVTQVFCGATIELLSKGETIYSFKRDLKPGEPLIESITAQTSEVRPHLAIRVKAEDGNEIIFFEPRPAVKKPVPPAATEPPAPATIGNADELFITGLHLEQYRHATRCPTPYWREALRRDRLDSRCNNAMGLWHLRRGEFSEAQKWFGKAIERLTQRNANPYDCEPFYNLGLCLRYQMDGEFSPDARLFEHAYAAFYKATWDQRCAMAGFHALAEMDCRQADWPSALEHLDRSLRLDTDNLRARNLKSMALRKLDRQEEANDLLAETLALDRLDWWARHLNGEMLQCDLQVRLDIVHDLARAGLYPEAIQLLTGIVTERRDLPDQNWGAMPTAVYTLGWLHEKNGDERSALESYLRAAAESPDYCFPSRLEEISVLEAAMRANPKDARAPYYLGNLFYDRRRHAEAIKLWERATRLDPGFSIVWRNLGIGYFNILKAPAKARAVYDKAFKANPGDARLLFERDQLWKRLGEKPEKRLRELEEYPQLTAQRDDLSVELCALNNQTGRPEAALEILSRRKFQPWEGGEGLALGQHVRTHLTLGRMALARKDYTEARGYFEGALATPENLGEATHLLANQSDICYWLGMALEGLRDKAAARKQWQKAAAFKGDFQEMSVRTFSEMTFYSAMALKKMRQKARATRLFRELLAYAKKLGKAEAKIDYFATSLPTMLVFEDDLQFRQQTTALFLEAQARLGLGQKSGAKKLLQQVLRRDPSHSAAAEIIHFEFCISEGKPRNSQTRLVRVPAGARVNFIL